MLLLWKRVLHSSTGKARPRKLYKVLVTAGFTSTSVECLFAAPTRADSPKRRSMKTERAGHLAYLAFENKTLIENIKFESFLSK